jgi:TatD DNase family protein
LKLIDTHAHLDEIPDLEGALKRAQDAGVLAVVGVGTDQASNEKILRLADRFPRFVLPAVGLHPWHLDRADPEANLCFIEKELPGCVALGEVGLDFAIQTPRERQEEVLRRLLALACREKKPVLLHARRAWAEALRMLKSFPVEGAIFHWFSGPPEVLQEIFEQGYLVSATPAAAYSARHRQAILATPWTRLVLETDAPEKYEGKPSEPRDLLKTLEAVSRLKHEPPEEVASRAWQNSVSFFHLSGV